MKTHINQALPECELRLKTNRQKFHTKWKPRLTWTHCWNFFIFFFMIMKWFHAWFEHICQSENIFNVNFRKEIFSENKYRSLEFIRQNRPEPPRLNPSPRPHLNPKRCNHHGDDALKSHGSKKTHTTFNHEEYLVFIEYPETINRWYIFHENVWSFSSAKTLLTMLGLVNHANEYFKISN